MKQTKSNMRKRIQALGVVVVLCVMSWTVVPKADEVLTEGDYQYSVLGDETVEITKYVGTEEEVVVPDSLDGRKITVIGDGAFNSYKKLTSIRLPQELTRIASGAFAYCKALKYITIPSKVTSIGGGAFFCCGSLEGLEVDENNKVYYSEGDCVVDIETKTIIIGCNNSVIPADATGIAYGAFSDCVGLTDINIPSGVTSIGISAFYGCTGLTSIIIPASVKEISLTAFSGCTSLSNVTIMNGLTLIGQEAFSGCTSLSSITIPESVTDIGWATFQFCSGLTSLKVDENNATYYSEGNCIMEKASKNLLYGCKTSAIPSDVKAISINAFRGCSGLTSITIPASVERIDTDAFMNCDNLATIYAEQGSYAATWGRNNGYNVVDGTTPTPSIPDVPSPTEPTKPDTTTQHPQETQTTQQQSTTEAAPTTATTPTTEASPSMAEVGTALEVTNADCKVRVTSASQEKPTVEYIAAKNKKASEIQIPDSVTVNGITYKVTAVAKKAFSGNKKVKKIMIGKNVTSIGKNAFADCKNLKTIVVKSTKLTKKSIAKNVLKGTNKKLTIKVPKNKLTTYKKYFKGKGNKTVIVKKF